MIPRLLLTALLLASQPAFANLDAPPLPGAVPNALGQLPSMGGGVASSTIAVSAGSITNNTASETSCFSPATVGPGQTIAANAPYVGNKFRLKCTGYYSVPLANTASITVKVKWGSVTIASFQATPVPTAATNYPFSIEATCTVQTIGTAGSVICNGWMQYAAVLTATSLLAGPIFSTSPVAMNTTIPNKLDLTSTWSAVSGGQTVTGTEASIEILY